MLANSVPFTPLSQIEKFLLISNHELVKLIFCRLPASVVIVLGKTNRRLQFITRYFMNEIWNLRTFYRQVFYDEAGAAELLASGDVMLYGPLVFRFFDKTMVAHVWDAAEALDVCVHVQALDKLVDFMSREGFFFNSHETVSFIGAINKELANIRPWKLKSSGERNASQKDRSAWGPYNFGRLIQRNWYQRVRIHVVRCEPYQHILSLHSTALMHFIAWNRAISIFPRSTFTSRVSFVASQEEVREDKTGRSFQKWFFAYAKTHKIRLVGLDHRRYERAELGKRYIGDQRSWIIPYVGKGDDAIPKTHTLHGPHFEVLDWTSSTTRADSYIRIGEPEIWRSVQIHRAAFTLALIEFNSFSNAFRSLRRAATSHWSRIRFSTYHEQNN
ncbi:hypothetical protein CVT26_003819 [Gymnopilus dilepis]|uniref:Uncharacterized protein n=1 Tax=Gymnopilus dilepis TaxID=231916 RepID=A0A409YM79_9AGAR|nr:hypothetical protein CVT26_003819 [Gymnopilus dilepis]